ERFEELLSNYIARSNTAACGPANFFRDVREKLSGLSVADFRRLIIYPRGLDVWLTSDTGCRPSLIAMSFGGSPELQRSAHPPVEPFLELLKAASADPERSSELLLERYKCPLCFTLPEEEKVREYVLMRLMTSDRALAEKALQAKPDKDDTRIEKDLLSMLEQQDVLLKLNLVAVMAARTTDLRFLDALNYYYELLPALMSRTGHDSSPLASFFALYAQALAARI
ncbi:MAG TPA: hypothetical protein VF766_11555, partial [Pyrinomonadaceae bacterium]